MIPTFSIKSGFLYFKFEILRFHKLIKRKIIFFLFDLHSDLLLELFKKKIICFCFKVNTFVYIFSCTYQCNYEIYVWLLHDLHLNASCGFLYV